MLSKPQAIDRLRRILQQLCAWLYSEPLFASRTLRIGLGRCGHQDDNQPSSGGTITSTHLATPSAVRRYRSNEPEAAELPGEWESKCNELQRMIFVRSLRIDRAVFASTTYVANSLGRKFVEPPVLDLMETVADSSPFTPLIFVLSPGVDPTANLAQLALVRVALPTVPSTGCNRGVSPLTRRRLDFFVYGGFDWLTLLPSTMT